MLTLANGDKYRLNSNDPHIVEGYTLEEDGKTFTQNFLPCKYRTTKSCSTCPKIKAKPRPYCSLKNIDSRLVCVGCSERDEGTGNV